MATIKINVRKYGLSYKGKVQVSTNLTKLQQLAETIAGGMFPQPCEIFDMETGLVLKKYV